MVLKGSNGGGDLTYVQKKMIGGKDGVRWFKIPDALVISIRGYKN